LNRPRLEALLNDVRRGALSAAAAAERLARLPFEDLDFARVDHHRALRCGFPEVIFGLGKTPAQIAAIFARLAVHGGNVLATHVEPPAARLVARKFRAARYDPTSRTLVLRRAPAPPGGGLVGIVCAGTSDLPVAEEARITAELLGQRTQRFYDVGVAGLHRLLAELDALRAADVLVVVAGMEGALPSVVGGLVQVPVVAVPTSVGYGASFGGLAALLGMLNSCASGVSVVNINNGFGAGFQAALIARVRQRPAAAPPARAGAVRSDGAPSRSARAAQPGGKRRRAAPAGASGRSTGSRHARR
jgi:hypothetical protein